MTQFRISIVAAFGISCCSCFFAGADRSHELRVRRGTLVSDVVLSGELRAARGDDIVVPRLPQWQTSIKWIAADGTAMKGGDRVAELDNAAFASNLDAKRQTVAQSHQELQQKEGEWAADTLSKELDVKKRQTESDKAKLDAAVPPEIVSAREYSDRQIKLKRSEVELAKAIDLLKAQRTGVKVDRENLLLTAQRAERELEIAERAIEELILRAPHDGIVVIRDHPWEGRRLQDGDAAFVGMPLAQFPDMTSLEVQADLADVDDGKIRAGMPSTVILDAYPSISFPARVVSISAVAQESSRTSLRRAFRVVVALDRVDSARMRPGLSARVIVHATTETNALLVSRAALEFSGKETRARRHGGKLTVVTLGACNAQECIVKSGLDEGAEVERPDA